MLCGGGRGMAPMCCVPPDGMSSNFCSDVEDMRRVAAIDVHGHFGMPRRGRCCHSRSQADDLHNPITIPCIDRVGQRGLIQYRLRLGDLVIPRLANGQPTNTQNGALPEQFQGYTGGPRVPFVDAWSGAS
jgi:hypothetical protein